MKDHHTGLIVLLILLVIALTGGFKNSQRNAALSQNNSNEPVLTDAQKKAEIEQKITDLNTQLKIENDKKIYSVYRGLVRISSISRSSDASGEYTSLDMSSSATTTVPITGWTLKSLSSGSAVTIPKGTNLFFANTLNSEGTIVLTPGDRLYLVTGISPNGSSFRLNKCSGYLSQFQTFVPYISTSCPAPRNENLSSIPQRVVNDACLDYIESFPTCRIQTESLPQNWTPECTSFIYNKINYPSCVDTHKNDPDFYLHEWRVYLKRSEPLWKSRREDIVLYDSIGKIVDEYKY